jgi:hypothetical protein
MKVVVIVLIIMPCYYRLISNLFIYLTQTTKVHIKMTGELKEPTKTETTTGTIDTKVKEIQYTTTTNSTTNMTMTVYNSCINVVTDISQDNYHSWLSEYAT